jgi:hypothetical protein
MKRLGQSEEKPDGGDGAWFGVREERNAAIPTCRVRDAAMCPGIQVTDTQIDGLPPRRPFFTGTLPAGAPVDPFHSMSASCSPCSGAHGFHARRSAANRL